MTRNGVKGCIVIIALLCFVGSKARAQLAEWVHLDPLEGEAVVEFEGRNEDRAETGESRLYEFEEGLRLRQGGDVIHPRIATFAFEAEPRFSQGRSEGPNAGEDLDQIFLNFSGRASVLHGTDFPFSMDGSAARATGDIDGSLGSRTEFTNDSRDVSVNWRNFAFPTSLTYSERIRDETFRSGLTSTTNERDDILRRLSLSGRSSKMNARIEREDFNDRVEGRDNDRLTDRARLNHRFEWGKGSRLASNFSYVDQSGFNQSQGLTLNENATIQHTEDLFSRTSYSFLSTTAPDFEITAHAGRFGLTHQLYNNLTTSFDSDFSRTESNASLEDEYGAELNLQYRKAIFEEGRLSLGAGGGYRLTDRQSEGGLLRVIDESQIVGTGGIVRLNGQFIETATIVVTDITGTITFDEGSDYLVVSTAENFTELFIVSGGAINFGDTILASYQFEDQPSAKFTSVPFQVSAGVDFGWISLFHRTSGENRQQISGPETSPVVDRLDSTTRLELSWERPRTRATFGSEYRIFRLGDLATDTIRFDQTAFHTFSSDLSLLFSANESFIEDNLRSTDLYTANLSLQWRPLPELFVTTHGDGFLRQIEQEQDTGPGDRTEWFVAAGVDLTWAVRQIKLTASYDHKRRGGDTSDLVEDRIMLRLSRRF